MNLSLPLADVLRTTKAHLKKLSEMGLTTVSDLLLYYPRTIESTHICERGTDIAIGEKNTCFGRLSNIRKQPTRGRKTITKAALTLNDESIIDVVWFQTPYLLKNLSEDTDIFLVGKITRNYGTLQLSNPELHIATNVHTSALRAVYPESSPITSKWLREKITGLLTFTNDFGDPLPHEIVEEEDFISKKRAVQQIHKPKNHELWEEARKRLAFEELFVIQTRVLHEKLRREEHTHNAFPYTFDPEKVKQDITKLPFELTFAQKRVLFQSLQDLNRDRPMYRLVQGDVGSGKTIVAFLALLQIVREGGYQGAILAPTEILAQQHFANALKYFPPEIHVEILTGSVTAKKKEEIKTKLRNGDIHIIIGTHAILTEDTVFKHLGLAIIDEQHRFGVAQRAILAENKSHILAMTATPIPRTLALTVYGDQDLSVIDELPAGRKTIHTKIIASPKDITTCNRFIDDQIGKGFQIFWVCPLVDESDKIEAKNVHDEYDRIAHEVFPNRRVEFLHGKMKPKEKETIMTKFKNHEADILVSTSVIEVGVDIPNATVMVIENSERFGLAQLHQFRGRIGRNDKQSYCFLMVGKPDDTNKTRLKAMEKSNNGLYLAEEDLKLRGMGEIYGTRQSGLPNLRCADVTDTETMIHTREWAQKILKKDPDLKAYPALRHEIKEQEVYIGKG